MLRETYFAFEQKDVVGWLRGTAARAPALALARAVLNLNPGHDAPRSDKGRTNSDRT
jgi:hypothetical protein